tara:strand:+ start:28908 stop:30590 length:1683 start_codon:yes stop_codon:yes gene_type:complete
MKKKISLDLDNLSPENCRKLDNIYFRSQKNFLSVLDTIFKQTNGDRKWFFSSLFGRDHQQSKLYLNLCYLKLIDEIQKKNKIETLSVENSALKNTILSRYPEINVKVRNEYFKFFSNLLKIFYNLIVNLIFILNLALAKSKVRKNKIISQKKIILIETFFLKNMFKNNQYFGGKYPSAILEKIDKKTKDKVFLCPTILINRPLKKYIRIAEKSYKNYVFFFDFLNLKDYFKSLFNFFYLGRIKKKDIYFNSYKINFLISREKILNTFSQSTFVANINYYFFKRLQENDVDLELVIDWYENQVIDRGFNLGKNTFFPNTKSKGYMGYVADFDGVQHFKPSILEKKTDLLPNEINVIGKNIKKKVKVFCKSIKISTAPAFRNQYLFSSNNYKKQRKTKKKIILIILNGTVKEEKNISNILRIIQKKFSQNNYLFRVRPHRISNLKEMGNLVFEIDKNNFQKSLSESDLVISGGSTASVEAVIFGKKVILIGNNNEFTVNPLRSFAGKDLYKVCYSPSEYEKAIKLYLNKGRNRIKKKSNLGKHLLKNYFERTTVNKCISFLR